MKYGWRLRTARERGVIGRADDWYHIRNDAGPRGVIIGDDDDGNGERWTEMMGVEGWMDG
jgi:hypothetical protein